MRTDKFIEIGYASEPLKTGDRLEMLPSTGLVRKLQAPGYDKFVTINADGSMDEKRVARMEKEGDEK